jgi:hypothetical protein
MSDKPTASTDHIWVGAALVALTAKQIKYAEWRGYVDMPPQRVDILECYCDACRRPYDDVADQPCAAAVNNEHLRGGPIGERQKRKHPAHDCAKYGCTIPKPVGVIPASTHVG